MTHPLATLERTLCDLRVSSLDWKHRYTALDRAVRRALVEHERRERLAACAECREPSSHVCDGQGIALCGDCEASPSAHALVCAWRNLPTGWCEAGEHHVIARYLAPGRDACEACLDAVCVDAMGGGA